MYYSGYTEEHLVPGYHLLLQKLAEDNFLHLHVCKKYAHKRFLKASVFAVEWARRRLSVQGEEMNLEE